MVIKILDTTLRDGEQQPGLALNADDKAYLAGLIDSLGAYQIEAGTPAMGGEEKKAIQKIASLKLKSRISAWNRMNAGDIRQAMDCGVDVIHISVPSSDLQISQKLGKSPEWVLEELAGCIELAKSQGFIVNVGLEDASRAKLEFLAEICRTARREGVEMVRYADTVGILHPAKITADLAALKAAVDIELGIHTHNDLGMALANAVAAVQAGTSFVDCTIGGIGERAGNCNFVDFIKLIQENFPGNRYDLPKIIETEQEILSLLFKNK